jgi:biopolymer transport protein ExbB
MQELIQQAGLVGYLLFFVVILATAIIFYKLYYFRYYWPAKETNLAQSITNSIKKTGALASMRKDEVFILIDTELQNPRRNMEKYLTPLASIASIAPLLGLLGTILGMIHSTRGIIDVNNTMLLKGISEALITTAIGIVIAIPSIIAYNYFVEKSHKIIEDLKENVFKRLER